MSITIQSPDLVATLAWAFAGRDPCHCHGDGKLSFTQVIDLLAKARMLDSADLRQAPVALDFAIEQQRQTTEGAWNYVYEIIDTVPGFNPFRFRTAGITTIEALTALSFDELLAVEGVGFKRARRIEAAMARHGHYLRDSNRADVDALVAAEDARVAAKEAAAAATLAERTPEQVRQWAADELDKLSRALLRDGMAVARMVRRVDRGDVRAGSPLVRYGNGEQFGAAIVEQVAAAVRAVEGAEGDSRRKAEAQATATAKARRLSAGPAAAPDLGANVVTLARRRAS